MAWQGKRTVKMYMLIKTGKGICLAVSSNGIRHCGNCICSNNHSDCMNFSCGVTYRNGKGTGYPYTFILLRRKRTAQYRRTRKRILSQRNKSKEK